MVQTPIVELDFFQIKDQLKAYLRGQSQFKDYDFEGSNMSVLLDVLAYNTYQNNFYTNMAISEMFLDSASLDSSVISHAKELNYLPRSATSSKALLNLRISAPSLNGAPSVVLPAGTKFFTNQNGSTYNFFTTAAHTAMLVNGSAGVYTVQQVPVYEGENVTETFRLSATKSALVLSNSNVDISSVRVFVAGVEYLYRSSIYGVEATDKVFYIEPASADQYSITFGMNTFGKQPSFNDDIVSQYRVCSGAMPNGANKFSTSYMYPTVVSTYGAASGGSEKESKESIKYFAPKSIQTQERAVTARDYETLLMKEFGSSSIKDVSVFGGDLLDPPRYGRVAISINSHNGSSISDGFKSDVLAFLTDKTPVPIVPIFIDPLFLYAKVDVNVYYSRKLTNKSSSELQTLVRSVIAGYSSTYLDKFGASLQLSRLASLIDDADSGITSNTIEANPIIDYSPPTSLLQNPKFAFETPLYIPYAFTQSVGINNYVPAIKSSVYAVDGVDGFMQDDGKGNIAFLSSLQNSQVLDPYIGSVDYSSGLLRLVDFRTSGYTGSAIKIYANTIDRNVVAPNGRIFSIRDADVNVNMVEVK